MLRDTRADQAYFDDVVEYLTTRCESNDRRFDRPVEKWADPKMIGQVAGDVMKQRWDRFSALYSQGASVEVLRADFDVVLSDAERALRLELEFLSAEHRAVRFAFGNSKDFYREWLSLVSLALAFRVDDATFDRVVAAVRFGWGDRLIDRLIATRRPEHTVGETLSFPKVVGVLDEAFDAGDPSQKIEKYLKNWYKAWKGVWGWGGHELVGKRSVYYGYWAFEALGVATALDIDDTGLRSEEFYPGDLRSAGVSA